MLERITSLMLCIKIALICLGAVVVTYIGIVVILGSVFEVIDCLKSDLRKGNKGIVN